MSTAPMTHDFVLVRSDSGDGGWSLHAPGSTDEDIATGEAPALTSGPSGKNRGGKWLRPNARDYAAARDFY
ncbi:hypothetical protein UFOVP469_27 [uncultured Caudovirales phage]|uniref:Uncharacterized protein n=1 Tax=uncultured Caudovirales phage TaxID=2100421 RepID=A0A6J5R7M0_9CAUD|nr:hypothetical protein UFOVP469_27 [uncultured Caudovirales phage]CAB4190377.1 hypothetical protein UFOVP1200_57 [uncultured Caudovirales phage]